MRFQHLLNKKFQELLEQVPGQALNIPLPNAGDPNAPVAPIPGQPLPAAPAGGQESPKTLTPEGEVFLVRLLRKALFMNPGDLDEKALKDLPDVNENNASDVLNAIVAVMKKYSDTIDVDTEPKE